MGVGSKSIIKVKEAEKTYSGGLHETVSPKGLGDLT